MVILLLTVTLDNPAPGVLLNVTVPLMVVAPLPAPMTDTPGFIVMFPV